MKNNSMDPTITRRDALKWSLAVAGAGLAASNALLSFAAELVAAGPMMTRTIPKSGEQLSLIGVGTNNFGVESAEEMAPIREVLRLMAENGANVIDTARVYGEIGRASCRERL